jgi:hypothetical protein
VTAIIAELEIDKRRDAEVHLIYQARKRYSRSIADGLLLRIRAGRKLFYGADDLLASAGLSLEDNALLEIALSETGQRDDRAEAAASVLGPQAVGRMIEAHLEVKKHLRAKYDQTLGDRSQGLLARIGHTPSANLIAAILARSAQAGNQEMADFADLIYRHPNGENDRGRPFATETLAEIRGLAKYWGDRMLASDNATRGQLAEIAVLASHAPSVELLPLLKRLLNEELRRWRAFKEQARADGFRAGPATNEASRSWTNYYQRAFQAIGGPETVALMRDYLRDGDFGLSAALVLADQWTTANEPRDGQRLWNSAVDFSRVEEKRAARASNPTVTSEEAEAIFSAIEPLITDEATEDQKKHAVALGTVAARLPHGQRDATIRKLISLAPRLSRADLLQSLILSGESIDIEMVKNGLAEMFEAAKTQSWILADGWELKGWLRLLPFAAPPAEAFAVVRALPDGQRRVDRLEEMIAGFRIAPGDDAENVLFQLADADQELYGNRVWCDAAIRRGTLSAARRLADLAANGAFDARSSPLNMAEQFGGLMGEHPELRAHVYEILSADATTPGLGLLARAVAENPDADGLLLLINIEMKCKRSFMSWNSIQNVVTEHRPSENWKGTYEVVPVPAVELRQKLLDMTTDGGRTDVAARYLNRIDKIRDEYGAPDSEPRHPDLASGKAWPMIVPDPDA